MYLQCMEIDEISTDNKSYTLCDNDVKTSKLIIRGTYGTNLEDLGEFSFKKPSGNS